MSEIHVKMTSKEDLSVTRKIKCSRFDFDLREQEAAQNPKIVLYEEIEVGGKLVEIIVEQHNLVKNYDKTTGELNVCISEIWSETEKIFDIKEWLIEAVEVIPKGGSCLNNFNKDTYKYTFKKK